MNNGGLVWIGMIMIKQYQKAESGLIWQK